MPNRHTKENPALLQGRDKTVYFLLMDTFHPAEQAEFLFGQFDECMEFIVRPFNLEDDHLAFGE
jgi:hypothetical protein